MNFFQKCFALKGFLFFQNLLLFFSIPKFEIPRNLLFKITLFNAIELFKLN